ncbi:MAG: phosphoribosylanthranilate isomerase [Clostridiales bacterium]|nr:phosphoribosylanthranilate isomerase [Clostridiales bacterium]
MLIKICGLRREQDIDYVNELKPDFAGFILTPGFRRSIDMETAKRLKSRLCGEIKAVGVFVDDDTERINFFVSSGIIDIVQLHGNESGGYCKKIKAPVIKCFKVAGGAAGAKLKDYDCEYFMFDSGAGSGQAFEWKNIPKTQKKFFLAGGLCESNLKSAIETVKPFALDISSGVETGGVKDYNKIKRILEIARYE